MTEIDCLGWSGRGWLEGWIDIDFASFLILGSLTDTDRVCCQDIQGNFEA